MDYGTSRKSAHSHGHLCASVARRCVICEYCRFTQGGNLKVNVSTGMGHNVVFRIVDANASFMIHVEAHMLCLFHG